MDGGSRTWRGDRPTTWRRPQSQRRPAAALFLERAKDGRIALDRRSVAVSDELGRLGRAAVPRLDALAGAAAASRWTGSGSEAVPVAGPTIGIPERASSLTRSRNC